MHIHLQRKIDKYLGYLLIICLVPVTRLLGILLRRNHTLSPSPKNILFIKLLGLGSLVAALDSIRNIKQQYPGARLILLTESNIADGIAPFGLFDELWTIRNGSFLTIATDALQYLMRSWKLRDLWIADLEVYSKLTTVYALLTFAINRFGFYLSPVFFRKYLNTHNIFFNQQTFLEDNYFAMAVSLTGESCKPISTNYIRPKNEYNLPFIALNNMCSDLAVVRKLPNDSFADICSWVLEHTPYSVALLGAPSDRMSLNDFIEEHSSLRDRKEKIVNYAGKTDFASYCRFLSEECACVVSIDSAPLHIAKKLGIPTVSVWGPTNPGNYLKIHPYEQERHLVYYQQVHCSPCIHHFEELPCKGDNFCMKDIEVYHITEMIAELLKTIRAHPQA